MNTLINMFIGYAQFKKVIFYALVRGVFILSFLSASCKEAALISDPFWNEVSGLSDQKMKRIALRNGISLKIEKITAKEEAVALIEQFYRNKDFIIFTPFWAFKDMDDLGEGFPFSVHMGAKPPEGNDEIRVRITFDRGDAFRQGGAFLADFLETHPVKELCTVMTLNDDLYESLTEEFQAGFGENGDLNVLNILKFSQYNKNNIKKSILDIDLKKSVIAVFMGELNIISYQALIEEGEFLFIGEDILESGFLREKCLGSVEYDYDTFFRKTLKTAVEKGNSTTLFADFVIFPYHFKEEKARKQSNENEPTGNTDSL